MAIAVHLTPVSMDVGRYDEIIRRLEECGATEPPGRLLHASFGSGDQLRVFGIWESQETFERFGATLMPILRDAGVELGPPAVFPLHNAIAGDTAGS